MFAEGVGRSSADIREFGTPNSKNADPMAAALKYFRCEQSARGKAPRSGRILDGALTSLFPL